MKLLTFFNPLTRTLRTQLALYFIPVSILPAVAISFYATRIFEETTQDTLLKRSVSERDAIVAEIDSLETDRVNETKNYGQNLELYSGVKELNLESLAARLKRWPTPKRIRLYSNQGDFITQRDREDPQIPVISKDNFEKLKKTGSTIDRYFSENGSGFITLVRNEIKEGGHRAGFIEVEWEYAQNELNELKNRRQVEVAFLNRSFKFKGWSFALPETEFQEYGKGILSWVGKSDPVFLKLGDSRYATFLYSFPMNFSKMKDWGYLAIFVPMGAVDTLTLKLKTNLIFITAMIIWVFALLIFFFSNRIVKPIEMLVLAMKRIKTGRVEEIPPIDSTYEIEYLVQAFNEMTRNVSQAKKTLEQKLEELRRANQEIKNTQGTLVQSAKMISLGQIVAGVAHELNNPIAFIYSNMHHLSDYLVRFKTLVEEYRLLQEKLPPPERQKMKKREEELEIDYILQDMEELIRSVVDGANRTKEIVTGLRTFSRMDEAVFKPEDIHEGLRSTIKLLSAEFKGRITLHEEYTELPLVECNLSQLNQVFMNLLSNAAHAIEGRGDIWVRTSRKGNWVNIEIEDSGKGIAQNHLEKIFDPFFTTKKVGEGTGLGLSIAYGLIQKHKGEISVKSTVGRGTCFMIQLPIHQDIQKSA